MFVDPEGTAFFLPLAGAAVGTITGLIASTSPANAPKPGETGIPKDEAASLGGLVTGAAAGAKAGSWATRAIVGSGTTTSGQSTTTPSTQACPVPSSRQWPGSDPSKAPHGTEWRGRPGSNPGSKQGNYYNPRTNESYRPDLEHPDPIGPHWDYRNAAGEWYRILPDGTVVPK